MLVEARNNHCVVAQQCEAGAVQTGHERGFSAPRCPHQQNRRAVDPYGAGVEHEVSALRPDAWQDLIREKMVEGRPRKSSAHPGDNPSIRKDVDNDVVGMAQAMMPMARPSEERNDEGAGGVRPSDGLAWPRFEFARHFSGRDRPVHKSRQHVMFARIKKTRRSSHQSFLRGSGVGSPCSVLPRVPPAVSLATPP